MTRPSPPEPRTLADAAARWLEDGARPTAPTQGAVRPPLEVARLARRIAGTDSVAVRLEILRREGAAVLSTVRPRPGEPAATLVVTPTSPPHRIERWRRLCPRLTVRTIDRPHLELVRPPYDAALGQLLCETAASGDRARPGCEGAGPHG